MSESTAILVIAAAALLVNVPLGWWRGRCRRLGPAWFVAVHASVPAIIGMRVWLDVPWSWAPLFIGCAVVGQWLGGRGATGRA